MDRLEARHIHPLSAPGLMPGMLGLALAVCSVMLLVGALRVLHTAPPAAHVTPPAGLSDEGNPGAGFRLISAAVICLVYALGLIGRVPYWLATALFVTVFIAFFEWEADAPASRRAIRLAWAVSLGLATGLAVSYAFRELFLVRLP
jgi:putative tricarboxylic transport membrane protein